jgi:D-alanyl-D-alanine carboxypeptidase
MKTARVPIFYLLLFVTILVGVLVPKEVLESENNQEGSNSKKENLSPSKKDEILISSNLTIKPSVQRTPSTKSANVIVTNKGDNLLVLINKNVRLPETYEPEDLVPLGSKVAVSRPSMRLRVEALRMLEKMAKAAEKDGVNLVVTSAYRSFWEQQATFSHWVGVLGVAQDLSASPGHSQHQLGTTIDFTSNRINYGLSREFEEVKEGNWMELNSYKYGFVLSYPKGKEAITGYQYEPWHYRYIGVENARGMADSGLILEEFLGRYGVW